MTGEPSASWPELSPVEREAVLLASIVEIASDLVNRGLFAVHPYGDGSQIQFNTSSDQRIFAILLVDFLSGTDGRGPVPKVTFLGALDEITQNPQFDVAGSVARLRAATEAFRKWLAEAPPIDVWFPTLDREITIALSRLDWIKMVGDLSKHDPLRAIGVAEKLARASGGALSLEDAILSLDDFYERYYTDILAYHSGTLAEFLNNIRWGVQDYLTPEYRRSYTHEGGQPPKYSFAYPAELKSRFAQHKYWDLMNAIRARPYMDAFSVDAVFKRRY